MRWSDTAYLISIISTKENTSLIKVFSEHHGCYTGVLFGSSSKKKNQICNWVIKSKYIIIQKTRTEWVIFQ